MKSSKIIKELEFLIANDKIKLALEKLMFILSENELLDELILQSAKYNEVMNLIRRGTITFQEANITKNEIRSALIEILRILKEGLISDSRIGVELERVNSEYEKIRINNSKNINTGNIKTKGGVHIGDNISK